MITCADIRFHQSRFLSGVPPIQDDDRMRKIRLELDRLHVDSFEPAPQDAELRGTVRGLVTAYWERCNATDTEDPNVNTCGPTQNSCIVTCFEQTCYMCGTSTCNETNVSCVPSCMERCEG
jgi:hypothetical protein